MKGTRKENNSLCFHRNVVYFLIVVMALLLVNGLVAGKKKQFQVIPNTNLLRFLAQRNLKKWMVEYRLKYNKTKEMKSDVDTNQFSNAC